MGRPWLSVFGLVALRVGSGVNPEGGRRIGPRRLDVPVPAAIAGDPAQPGEEIRYRLAFGARGRPCEATLRPEGGVDEVGAVLR